MISILTNTDVILKTGVSPQMPNENDPIVSANLALKLKRNLSSKAFKDQQSYLSISSIAAFLAFNKLDQSQKYRASVDLTSLSGQNYDFLEGSSSSGLGYSLALFSAWWTLALDKPGSIEYPLFATGEILKPGKLIGIGHINQKIGSLCRYLDTPDFTSSRFYFCFPKENANDVDSKSRNDLVERGGILICEDSLPKVLLALFGDFYDGAVLGRWEPFKYDVPFSTEDTLRYFGRQGEVSQIARLLDDHEVLLLTGPAKSGKTSMLKAGVIPVMQKAQELRFCYLTPEDFIEASVDIFSFIEKVFDTWDLRDKGVTLEEIKTKFDSSRILGLDVLMSLLDRETDTYLLVLDQAEAMFTKNRVVNTGFIEFLMFISDMLLGKKGIQVIISLRTALFESFNRLGVIENFYQYQLSSRLSLQDWQEIVHDQAAFSGIEFETQKEKNFSLDKVIRDDAARIENSLVFVQGLLRELEVRSEQEGFDQNILKFKHYHQIGGLEGFIISEASKIIGDLKNNENPNTFFDLFFSQDQNYKPHTLYVNLDDLYRNDRNTVELAKKFIDNGFLVSKGSSVSFTHEFLLEKWADLISWMQRSDPYLRWRHKIEREFLDWKEGESRSPRKDFNEIVRAQREKVLDSSEKLQIERNRKILQKYGERPNEFDPTSILFRKFFEGWRDVFAEQEAQEFLMSDLGNITKGLNYLSRGFVGDFRLREYILFSRSMIFRKYIARALLVLFLGFVFVA